MSDDPRAPDRSGASEYRLEHGSFYWYERGRMQFMCDQVAMAFDRLDGTLYKHGRPERIEAWAAEQRALLAGAVDDDGQPLFALATITFDRDYPVESINRCIHHIGFLKTLLPPPEPPGDPR